MNNKDQRKLIQDFLKQHSLAVISTVYPKTKKPESALITYAENKNLEIYFGTFQNERKYQNLQVNSSVSLVIGWDEKVHITIQYEGEARQLTDSELKDAQECFKQKPGNINSEEFLFHPKFKFF